MSFKPDLWYSGEECLFFYLLFGAAHHVMFNLFMPFAEAEQSDGGYVRIQRPLMRIKILCQLPCSVTLFSHSVVVSQPLLSSSHHFTARGFLPPLIPSFIAPSGHAATFSSKNPYKHVLDFVECVCVCVWWLMAGSSSG